MSRQEDSPIRLSGNRWFTVQGAVLISIVVAAGTAGSFYAKALAAEQKDANDITLNSHRLDDHEARIRKLEEVSARIDANIQQIKDWMEEDRRDGSAWLRQHSGASVSARRSSSPDGKPSNVQRMPSDFLASVAGQNPVGAHTP